VKTSARIDHIPTLDGLRGIAVLLVLWWHLPEQLFGPLNAALRFALQPGYLGVDIFFVLSGFLITRILLDEKELRIPVTGFLLRRIARIFPAYYLLLLIIGFTEPDVRGYWWSFAYLSNFYFSFDQEFSPLRHTWSLAIEEHFYLIWPWVVVFLPVILSTAILVYFVLPIAVNLAITTAYLEPMLGFEADALIYRITWYRMLSLGAGALLAYHETYLRTHPQALLKLSLLVGCAGAALLPTVLLVEHRWIGPIMLVGFSAVSTTSVGLAVWTHTVATWPAKLLRARALRGIGQFSYGLYLYHFPIFAALGIGHGDEVATPSPIRSLTAVLLSLAAAWISFIVFEKPIQQAVRRLLGELPPSKTPIRSMSLLD